MGFLQAVEETQKSLQSLNEELQSLHLMIVEDKPLKDCVLLVDQLGNTTEDFIGWCEEAILRTSLARRAAEAESDCHKVGPALGEAHERLLQLDLRFHSDLASYQRISELLALGYEKKGEWADWSETVMAGIERCQPLIANCQRAILQAWQELSAGSRGHVYKAVALHCLDT